MVDTQVLGTCALQRESSSLSSRTIYVSAGLLTAQTRLGVTSRRCGRVRFPGLTPYTVPFVYRLGRQVFNLKRGVRFPYGIPNKSQLNG